MPGLTTPTSGRRSARATFAAARLRAVRGAVALVLGGSLLGGCYVYVPRSAPVDDEITQFDLTDAGRVHLGPGLGEGARQIEGAVESRTDTSFTLRMRSVTYINGQTTPWTGERITVAPRDVTNPRARTFSKGRTGLVVGTGVAAVVGFIATRGLVGSGIQIDQPGSGTGGAQ